MKLRPSVASRVLLTTAVIVALVAGPAFYAVVRLGELRDIAAELGGRDAEANRALAALETARVELERYQRAYVVVPSPALHGDVEGTLDEARAAQATLRRTDYTYGLDELDAALDSLEHADRMLTVLVENAQMREATDYLASVQSHFSQLDVALAEIARGLRRVGEARVARARELSEAARRTALVTSVLGALLALALGIWLSGALGGPLRRLRGAMASVAAGRFESDHGLPYGREDEIGDLSRSFRAMTERLAELDRVKAEFVGIASHELKTPIGLIGGYVDLLDEALGTRSVVAKRCRPLFDPIREQTEWLRRLVDHLLELSRVSAGGFELQCEDVQTADFAANIEKSFRPLARRKSIDYSVVVELTAPAVFWADPDCLTTEVVGNLVGNALKFTPEGGTVRVRFSGGARLLMIEVADTGPGIPEEHQPFIFEKYYQAGQRHRRIGAGLGLAIAREIVQLHGGVIYLRSEPGQGTTFDIAIPARAGIGMVDYGADAGGVDISAEAAEALAAADTAERMAHATGNGNGRRLRLLGGSLAPRQLPRRTARRSARRPSAITSDE